MYELSEIGGNRNNQTSYEVHRRTRSGWELWATRGKVEQAIQEAKQVLEQAGTEAVRVVGDQYDPDTKLTMPNTVFRAVAPQAGRLGRAQGNLASGLSAALGAIGLGAVTARPRS